MEAAISATGPCGGGGENIRERRLSQLPDALDADWHCRDVRASQDRTAKTGRERRRRLGGGEPYVSRGEPPDPEAAPAAVEGVVRACSWLRGVACEKMGALVATICRSLIHTWPALDIEYPKHRKHGRFRPGYMSIGDAHAVCLDIESEKS